MFISGYHGTSLDAAQSIVASKEFHLSTGDKEWLGNGVYFYFAVDDAIDWNKSDAIIHAIIDVQKDNYLDLDEPKGLLVYQKAKELFVSKFSCKLASLDHVQENQCAVMRILWDMCSSVEVIAASFPTTRTTLKTLIDERRKRILC